MKLMNMALEYFFIYNPTLEPDNPKASEVEMMDAKKIFFYPTLVDINRQRNLIGIGEGFVSFYNSFNRLGSEVNNAETQVMVLNQRIMLSRCIDNDNYIVLILTHQLGDLKQSKYKAINRVSRVNMAIYKKLLDRFCKVYRTIFEPVQYYITSQETLIGFTESILRFVESYFSIEETNSKKHGSIDLLSKLFGDFIVKRKFPSSLTMPIVRTVVELKNDYQNFYDLLAFKSSYLIHTSLNDEVTKTLTSLLFDMSINESRAIESRPYIKFSKFFESFYDLELAIGTKNSNFVLSEFHNKKRISFNLPVIYGDDVKYYKFYPIFIVENDVLVLLLLKNKSVPVELLNRMKSLANSVNKPFMTDQPKSNNIFLGFFNVLNHHITNAVDMLGLGKMSKGELLIFVSTFFNRQEKRDRRTIYSYYMLVGESAIIFNLVNERITWIYSTDIDKYDVIDEFCMLKENVKSIIL